MENPPIDKYMFRKIKIERIELPPEQVFQAVRKTLSQMGAIIENEKVISQEGIKTEIKARLGKSLGPFTIGFPSLHPLYWNIKLKLSVERKEKGTTLFITGYALGFTQWLLRRKLRWILRFLKSFFREEFNCDLKIPSLTPKFFSFHELNFNTEDAFLLIILIISLGLIAYLQVNFGVNPLLLFVGFLLIQIVSAEILFRRLG